MSKEQEQPYFMVQSVDRAFSIFNLFIRERKALGITEIAEEVKLHKSVVHRLLATMKAHHLVEQLTDSGKYQIGPKAFELGSIYMNNQLFAEGKRYLPELAEKIGETAHLAILNEGSVFYLVNHVSPKPLSLQAPVGVRNAIHVTALGKALTAWMKEDHVIHLLQEKGMETRTKNSIGTVDSFLEELARVRELGYAVDDEEIVQGHRCIAAPLRDHTNEVVAAISVGGTSTRTIPPERTEEVAELVMNYAAVISERLGYVQRNIF